jgi:hypothetical protein
MLLGVSETLSQLLNLFGHPVRIIFSSTYRQTKPGLRLEPGDQEDAVLVDLYSACVAS